MDFEKKISDWLEKQGYPLEMLVAQKFRKQNYSVSQSLYYYDAELGKNREIDILAHRSILIEDSFVSIDYVIECKSSENPWLLFTEKRIHSYDPIIEAEEYLYTKNAFPIIVEFSSKDLVKKLHPPYFDFEYIGYGLTQAFNNRNDIAYKAIHQLYKYCISLIKVTDEAKYIDCKIIVPILAIDSPLFEVILTENFEIKIRNRKMAFLSVKNLISEYQKFPIIIVTKDYFEQFCKAAEISSEWLMKYCKDNLKSIWKEHQKLLDQLYTQKKSN